MDIGKEFNLSPTTVANWVRAADKRQAAQDRSTAAGHGGGESDNQKVRRLERELAGKEEELQILGKRSPSSPGGRTSSALPLRPG